jgi:hypothetical protein
MDLRWHRLWSEQLRFFLILPYYKTYWKNVEMKKKKHKKESLTRTVKIWLLDAFWIYFQ